ncbi:MAG: hypothetical protein M3Q10_14240 [Chloroflexota bacterium]|nr:hypothetical protein [Chloroflexota bacterium]
MQEVAEVPVRVADLVSALEDSPCSTIEVAGSGRGRCLWGTWMDPGAIMASAAETLSTEMLTSFPVTAAMEPLGASAALDPGQAGSLGVHLAVDSRPWTEHASALMGEAVRGVSGGSDVLAVSAELPLKRGCVDLVSADAALALGLADPSPALEAQGLLHTALPPEPLAIGTSVFELAEGSLFGSPLAGLGAIMWPASFEFDPGRVAGLFASQAGTSFVVHGPVGSAITPMSDVFQNPIDLLRLPGTADGDLYILESPNAHPAAREAALQRLVERIPWLPRNWEVRANLGERARVDGVSVRTVMDQELRAAVVLVLGTTGRPQRHRFGRNWLKDDGGRTVEVAPDDLEWELFWAWFRAEVIEAAEAAVLDRPFPAAGDVLDRRGRDGRPLRARLDDCGQPADPTDDPLLVLLDGERRAEEDGRMLAALSAASPRQRQLLALIGTGASEAEAARRLGMAPATARHHLHRLRQKLV